MRKQSQMRLQSLEMVWLGFVPEQCSRQIRKACPDYAMIRPTTLMPGSALAKMRV